jgi:hypothetical protein
MPARVLLKWKLSTRFQGDGGIRIRMADERRLGITKNLPGCRSGTLRQGSRHNRAKFTIAKARYQQEFGE